MMPVVLWLAPTWLPSAALSIALLFGCLARAHALEPTYSLNWVRREGAEGCASSQLLARAVEQLLGPVLRTPGEAQLAIEGMMAQPEGGVFEMEMRVLTPQGEVKGERKLRRAARTCSELTSAVLLVLTLTLDPESAEHGFPTELLARIADVHEPELSLLSELEQTPLKAVVPATPQPARVSPLTATRAETPPPPTRALRATLQLGPALVVGLTPNLTWGAQLAAALNPIPSLAVLLELGYWAPSAADIVAFGVRRSVKFSAAQAQIGLCFPALPGSTWQFSACAGGALGLRWADASALTYAKDTRRPYGGPLVKLALSYAIDARWFAALDVTGALLWPRDRFTYRDPAGDSQPLFEPKLASLWSSLNVGVRL